jgi:protein kinase X
LKDGTKDIKKHKWFSDRFSWEAIEGRTAKPFYIPTVKDSGDTANFSSYPDSPEEPPVVT